MGLLENNLRRNLPPDGREGQRRLREVGKGREVRRLLGCECGSGRGRERERRGHVSGLGNQGHTGGFSTEHMSGPRRQSQVRGWTHWARTPVDFKGKAPSHCPGLCSQSSGEREQALSAHRWSSF